MPANLRHLFPWGPRLIFPLLSLSPSFPSPIQLAVTLSLHFGFSQHPRPNMTADVVSLHGKLINLCTNKQIYSMCL